MKKMKMLGALALASLTATTLASCGNDANLTAKPSTSSSEETTPIETKPDISDQINSNVLAYAKVDVLSDMSKYLENLKLLSNVANIKIVSDSLDLILDESKKEVDGALNLDAVDKIYDNFIKECLITITNYKTESKKLIEAAIIKAQNEFDDYSVNGLYRNTKDDGSIEKFRLYAISIFTKADSLEEITLMYTEACNYLEQLFTTLLEESYNNISTYDELLNMESGKNYRLTNDIDFEGVQTTGSTILFDGVFDGNGYTIKNWNITSATVNKCGLLFKAMSSNSIVQNVRFMNVSHIGDQEGIAIITGEAINSTFKNIEFYGCKVDALTKSYAGLLVGRKLQNGVVVDQITVKGNSQTSATYGGGLIGDARDMNKADATFTNLDIDLTMNIVSNTGGLLIGRTDASKMGKIIVKNAKINANITGNSTKAGLLFDGATEFKDYICENVLLSANNQSTITSDIFVGQKYGPTVSDNIWYIKDKTNAVVTSKLNEVNSNDLSSDWYYDVLKLDKDIWVLEGNGEIRLKGASSNVVSLDSELIAIDVYASRAKTYYYFGDEFDGSNLVVVGTYQDKNGIILQANLSTKEVANLGSYSLDTQEFDLNNTKAGTYTINVIASKKYVLEDTVNTWVANGSYQVTVNVVQKLNVYANEASVVFIKGQEFNQKGLVVKAVYSNDDSTTSDDVESTVKNTQAKQVYSVNYDNFKKDEVGKYQIDVTLKENETIYEGYYEVEVLDRIDVLGLETVEVLVDDDLLNSVIDLEVKTASFNSINKALSYLEALNLNEDVKKVINIKNGTYHEKVIVNIPNVSFIGESEEEVIITYNTAAGFKQLDETLGNYGTDNSATVLIKANNFSAKNVTFVNAFDYINDNTTSDKQALAIGVYADEAVFYNCSFKGYQDTLQTKQGRQYFYECYIEGNVDFIFGVDATTYFDKCEIKSLNRFSDSNGGYIVAPKTSKKYTFGFYFNECNFTYEEGVTEGSVSIARPWGADGTCVVMNSTLGKHISKLSFSEGNNLKINSRYEDMSGNMPMDANFKEYNNTGDGAISIEVEGGSFISSQEALELTNLTNLFKADSTLNYQLFDVALRLETLKK